MALPKFIQQQLDAAKAKQAASAAAAIPTVPAPSNTPPLSTSVSATNQILHEINSDEDGPVSDTQGFYFDDDNIFDLHKTLVRKKQQFPVRGATIFDIKKNKTLSKLQHRPGDFITVAGEHYEYLGPTDNLVGITSEEINSFEGEGEYSEFGKKFFKKIGKVVKAGVKVAKIAKLATPGGAALKGASLAKGLFRRFKKKRLARFDGLEEVEYFIGDLPEHSSLFGIKLKKIGQALKRGVKKLVRNHVDDEEPNPLTLIRRALKGRKKISGFDGQDYEFLGEWDGDLSFLDLIEPIAPPPPGSFLFRVLVNQSYDGTAEYEYYTGEADEISEFIKFKKIGKALKKGIKAVGKGIGKGAKAVGKGAKNLGKWVGKMSEKAVENGALNNAVPTPSLSFPFVEREPHGMDLATPSYFPEPQYEETDGGYDPDEGNVVYDPISGTYLRSPRSVNGMPFNRKVIYAAFILAIVIAFLYFKNKK